MMKILALWIEPSFHIKEFVLHLSAFISFDNLTHSWFLLLFCDFFCQSHYFDYFPHVQHTLQLKTFEVLVCHIFLCLLYLLFYCLCYCLYQFLYHLCYCYFDWILSLYLLILNFNSYFLKFLAYFLFFYYLLDCLMNSYLHSLYWLLVYFISYRLLDLSLVLLPLVFLSLPSHY